MSHYEKIAHAAHVWQTSEVVTHSYDANDTSFINIVFLSFAPNIYIYQSIYTDIYRTK